MFGKMIISKISARLIMQKVGLSEGKAVRREMTGLYRG